MLRDLLTAAQALVLAAWGGATIAASRRFASHPSMATKNCPTRSPPPQTEQGASAPPAAPATTGTVEPASPPATAGATTSAGTPAAAAAPGPQADPIVAALRTKLTDAAWTGKSNKDDVAALVAFYAERT